MTGSEDQQWPTATDVRRYWTIVAILAVVVVLALITS